MSHAFGGHDQNTILVGNSYVYNLISVVFKFVSTATLLSFSIKTNQRAKFQLPLPFDSDDLHGSSPPVGFQGRLLQSRHLCKGYRLSLANAHQAIQIYIILSTTTLVLYTVNSHSLYLFRPILSRSCVYADNIVLLKLYTKGLAISDGWKLTLLPMFILALASVITQLDGNMHSSQWIDALSALIALICTGCTLTTFYFDSEFDTLNKNPVPSQVKTAIRFGKAGLSLRFISLVFDLLGARYTFSRVISIAVSSIADNVMTRTEHFAETVAASMRSYTLLPLFTLRDAQNLRIMDASGGANPQTFPEGYDAQIRRTLDVKRTTFQERRRQQLHQD